MITKKDNPWAEIYSPKRRATSTKETVTGTGERVWNTVEVTTSPFSRPHHLYNHTIPVQFFSSQWYPSQANTERALGPVYNCLVDICSNVQYLEANKSVLVYFCGAGNQGLAPVCRYWWGGYWRPGTLWGMCSPVGCEQDGCIQRWQRLPAQVFSYLSTLGMCGEVEPHWWRLQLPLPWLHLRPPWNCNQRPGPRRPLPSWLGLDFNVQIRPHIHLQPSWHKSRWP